VSIVERAIQRIDVPDLLLRARQLTAFLGDDAVAGKTLPDLSYQVIFGAVIGFRNEVNLAFLLYLQILPRTLAQDSPGSAS
jgi:hypothetical protein